MLEPFNNPNLDEKYSLGNMQESANAEALKLCKQNQGNWPVWYNKVLHGIMVKSDKEGYVSLTPSFANGLVKTSGPFDGNQKDAHKWAHFCIELRMALGHSLLN
jgi:hypothetical protein